VTSEDIKELEEQAKNDNTKFDARTVRLLILHIRHMDFVAKQSFVERERCEGHRLALLDALAWANERNRERT